MPAIADEAYGDAQTEDVVTIGRDAEFALADLEITSTKVRHPSHGGQKEFLNGIYGHYKVRPPIKPRPHGFSELGSRRNSSLGHMAFRLDCSYIIENTTLREERGERQSLQCLHQPYP